VVKAFADCTSDPNECTLKKLCEVATALDGSNTIWSTASGSSKHVKVAQSLGMECGVTPIVDLCDTDPSECKVSEICGKATTDNAGQISWDDSAAGHVALAKEYGLGCNVSEETALAKSSCSKETPEVCPAEELCRIATHIQGYSRLLWSINKYKADAVKEAKKRGLSCGVKAVVKKTCSASTPEVCSTEALCSRASQISGNSKIWKKISGKAYVIEAKKRGLDCGVVQNTGACNLTHQKACDDPKVLCSFATTSLGQWETSSHFIQYVSEAKKRGLSCGVTAVVTNTCSAKTSEVCSFKELCQRATRKIGGAKTWAVTSIGKTYVKEAKKRGLDCGVKAEVEKKCSSKTPEVCSYAELCRSSTEGSGNSKTWTGWSAYENYVKEAKKRGLDCGVKAAVYNTFITSKFTGHGAGEVTIGVADKSTVWNGERFYSWPSGAALFKSDYRAIDLGTYRPNGDTNTIFSAVTRQFQQQSLSQRKTIQRNLKNKNLYASSVDGVWGRNTLIALVDYSSKRLRTVDLRSNAIVSILLKEIKQDYLHTTKPVADYVLANVKKDQAKVNKLLVQNSDLKKVFGRLSVLEKKQMQYALKKLGFYRGAVDAIWGKNTNVALSNFISNEQVNPKNALFVLTEKVTVPNSFVVAKRPTTSSSSGSSSSSSSGRSTIKKILGGAAIIACALNDGCRSGMANEINGGGSDALFGSTGSSSASSSSSSSSASSNKQCSYDSQCGFRGKCVKRLGKSMCVKLVDEEGRKIRDRNAGPIEDQCRRDSDCPRKFECNRQFRICVAK